MLIVGLGIWWGPSAVRAWISGNGTDDQKAADKPASLELVGKDHSPQNQGAPGNKASVEPEVEEDQSNPSMLQNDEQLPRPAETEPRTPTMSKPRGLIVIDSPQDGEVIIGSSFVLSGKADVSANALFYEVEDGQRQQWVAGAAHTSGKWGGFFVMIDLRDSKQLSITRGSPRRLSIKIHSDSSQQSELATLSVTLVP